MSDHISVLSNQNGDLVGRMSFQERKIICSPAEKHPLHLQVHCTFGTHLLNSVWLILIFVQIFLDCKCCVAFWPLPLWWRLGVHVVLNTCFLSLFLCLTEPLAPDFQLSLSQANSCPLPLVYVVWPCVLSDANTLFPWRFKWGVMAALPWCPRGFYLFCFVFVLTEQLNLDF